MMCTCCAAPVTAGMRKQQVSMGGALAFWMGTAAQSGDAGVYGFCSRAGSSRWFAWWRSGDSIQLWRRWCRNG